MNTNLIEKNYKYQITIKLNRRYKLCFIYNINKYYLHYY